ncbi:hypothetical protein C4571_02705 [Candidatus Parcubacteria bacterium]|nr:MAG: hypothetical protein C4571_02705 [Candidatus Parcubacteria bacterium]
MKILRDPRILVALGILAAVIALGLIATGDSVIAGAIAVVIILGLVIAAFDAIVLIPEFHYGVKILLRKPKEGTLPHGPHPKWPLIERVVIVSRKLQTFTFGLEFTAGDTLRIVVRKVVLQFRPDPEAKAEDLSENDPHRGRNAFISVDEVSFKEGLPATVQSRLEALGGTVDAEDLIHGRHAIIDFIHCVLMADTMPHDNHDPANCEICESLPEGDRIPKAPLAAKYLIRYYSTHFKLVKEWLKTKKPETKSLVERRFGIEVVGCEIAGIEFTEKTEAIQEERKQAEARKKVLDAKAEAMRGLLGVKKGGAIPGLTPQMALNLTEATFNPEEVERRVISVEGDAGLGALVSALGDRKGGK